MRFSKKKASPPMEDLIKYIDSVLAAAGESCTQCLIDDLGNDSAELADVIARLGAAYLLRDIAPGGEEELTAAFSQFLARVTKMAVLTGELTHRPGVRWTDDTIETGYPVIVISPN
jgi:hypothetical protein